MASQSISFKPVTAIKELPWSINKKTTLGFLLLVVAFSLVGSLYLSQASAISTSTLEMDGLHQQIDTLQRRNKDLSMEIAAYESIDHIETRAKELGFSPTSPEAVRYLAAPNFPATEAPQQSTALTTYMAYATEPSFRQTWLDKLISWVSGRSE